MRRALLAAVLLATIAPASTAAGSGPLTGTWKGKLTPHAATGRGPGKIVIVVNASETGGSWRLGPSCHGPLVLDSISGGYHHYRRKLAPGSTCKGGDIDCLKRVGGNVYDSVTARLGGAYNSGGTLRRV